MFIEEAISHNFSGNKKLRMLELGDQLINDTDKLEYTGKEYFKNRGYSHISVDINGLHGAEVRNLCYPSQFQDFFDHFDICTNCGTSEHVEPFDKQYECYLIIHHCIKKGGLYVHIVPDVNERDERGLWIDHCRFYYGDYFFKKLAKMCDYKIIANKVINGHRCVAMQKSNDQNFSIDRTEFLSWIAIRNYSKMFYIRGIVRKLGVPNLLRFLKLRS